MHPISLDYFKMHCCKNDTTSPRCFNSDLIRTLQPVQGRVSWPGGPAVGHTAVGCIEGRTAHMVTLQEERQQLMQQLATFGVLQFHGQSVALLLSLFRREKKRKNGYTKEYIF